MLFAFVTPVEKSGSWLLHSSGLLVWHLLTFWVGPSILVALPTIVSLGVLPCSVAPLRLFLWGVSQVQCPWVVCLRLASGLNLGQVKRLSSMCWRCDFAQVWFVSICLELNFGYFSLTEFGWLFWKQQNLTELNWMWLNLCVLCFE